MNERDLDILVIQGGRTSHPGRREIGFSHRAASVAALRLQSLLVAIIEVGSRAICVLDEERITRMVGPNRESAKVFQVMLTL